MKKIKFIFSLFFMCASPVWATCNGGTEVTGQNGHVYCRSNITMNWYSAFAWCDTQGRTLATMEQMCDIDETQRWDGTTGTGKCLNIIGTGDSDQNVWSAIPSGNVHAFYVNQFEGVVRYNSRALYSYYALCW